MSTLQDQLLEKGLVTKTPNRKPEPAICFAKASREPRYMETSHDDGGKASREVAIDDLELAQSAAEFKDMARKILLRDPFNIGKVIRKMQAFKGWDGWQDLPRIIYKVRDQLSRCPPNKLERFLSRALRRNNPQFSIPE